jgi:ferredoxin
MIELLENDAYDQFVAHNCGGKCECPACREYRAANYAEELTLP